MKFFSTFITFKKFYTLFPTPPPNFFGLKRVIYVSSFFLVPSAPNTKKVSFKVLLGNDPTQPTKNRSICQPKWVSKMFLVGWE